MLPVGSIREAVGRSHRSSLLGFMTTEYKLCAKRNFLADFPMRREIAAKTPIFQPRLRKLFAIVRRFFTDVQRWCEP
jgi:hypothetical protein